MTDDIDRLQEKIKAFKTAEQKGDEAAEARQRAQMSAGMRAGSEFLSSVAAGGIFGYGMGYFFGNLPLWMILFMFAGFGLGTWRAYKSMQ